MNKFELFINCTGEAFADPRPELSRILRDLADRLERTGLDWHTRIDDCRGRAVGWAQHDDLT